MNLDKVYISSFTYKYVEDWWLRSASFSVSMFFDRTPYVKSAIIRSQLPKYRFVDMNSFISPVCKL